MFTLLPSDQMLLGRTGYIYLLILLDFCEVLNIFLFLVFEESVYTLMTSEV